MSQVPKKNPWAVKGGASGPSQSAPVSGWRSAPVRPPPPPVRPGGPLPVSRGKGDRRPKGAAAQPAAAPKDRGLFDVFTGGSAPEPEAAWPAAQTVVVPGGGEYVEIVPGAPLSGGVVVVSVESADTPGAAGIFQACRSGPDTTGIVQRQVQVPGPSGERVDLVWRAGTGLLLCHDPKPGTGGDRAYRVRIQRPCAE